MPCVLRPSPYLIAGLGWLSHSGSSAAGGKTDFGPDVGVGLRLPVTSWLAPWVEGQFLTITQALPALGPNLLLSAGVSAKLLGF